MNLTKRKSRGFTLVELMIVVAIVGILAALAIYGVRRYILNSKTTEARNGLGQMSKDAATAYSREGMSADTLALGGSTDVSNRLCGSAAASVPAEQAKIAGKKYQSAPSEWKAGTAAVGWQCVKFSMQDPQYYMYSYISTGTLGAANDTFRTRAQGDLDGNGTLSDFQLDGKILDESGSKTVVIAPNIRETLPEE